MTSYCTTHKVELKTPEDAELHSSPECVIYESGIGDFNTSDIKPDTHPDLEELHFPSVGQPAPIEAAYDPLRKPPVKKKE